MDYFEIPELYADELQWNRDIGELFRLSHEQPLVFKDPFLGCGAPYDWSPSKMLDSPEKVSDEEYYEDDGILMEGENLSHFIMVDPKTGRPISESYSYAEVEEPQEKKPNLLYHWLHDHDYIGKMKEEIVEGSIRMDIVKEEPKSDSDEPVVEVWEIENFSQEPRKTDSSRRLTLKCSRVFEERTARRSSTRTAELKQTIQARKLTTALRAGLKNEKPKRGRQYKNIRPKNSVETTPSQSDIEEWSSQPQRQTKTTKKKTSKGRIDHSESERHRREVLRAKFAALCNIIPTKYLRGDKVSSQISKQKILNGAKAFIAALRSSKGSYKTVFQKNGVLKDRWQKKGSMKPLKSVRKK